VDLMARLPRLHAQRVAAEAAAYEQEAATLRAAHEAECAIVRKLNADIQRYCAVLCPSRTIGASTAVTRKQWFVKKSIHVLRSSHGRIQVCKLRSACSGVQCNAMQCNAMLYTLLCLAPLCSQGPEQNLYDCRRSDEEYYRMTEPLRTHNEVLMAAAAQQHEVAVKQCQREYSLAVMEWESLQVNPSSVLPFGLPLSVPGIFASI